MLLKTNCVFPFSGGSDKKEYIYLPTHFHLSKTLIVNANLIVLERFLQNVRWALK